MFQVNPLLDMKNQALFSSKDKSKKLKCHLLQFLFGALRVKATSWYNDNFKMEKKKFVTDGNSVTVAKLATS